MPRFSANISMLFAERAWLDRPAAAAAAGFGAIEIQFPYDRPADDWRRAIKAAGLAVSVINLPVGDMLAGGPGLAATPGRQAEFRAAVETARDYVALVRDAREAGLLTTLHTGGASIPGSFPDPFADPFAGPFPGPFPERAP